MARSLVRVELSFVTEDEPAPLGDRIREAVALIVGRDQLEEFRVRDMPMDPKKPKERKDHLRPVD